MDRRMGVNQALMLLVLFLSSTYAFIAGIDGPLLYQEALEDGNTTLHCDTNAEIVDDEIMLLVWYKNDESIYSYDARSGTEWSSPAFNTSGRLTIDIRKRPISLSLSKLREDDQAVFHCRVEFLLSPTKYTGVNLIVIVQPSIPFFLDELGNKIENKVGPYFEGDTLVLNCLVIGGRPPPQVRWFSGDVLVDATGNESDIPNVRENELYLPLARDTAENVSCKASNTKLSPPVTAFVDIELYLSADNVSINWIQGIENGGLIVGITAIIQCIATGVYPSPDIAWWLNDKHLTHYSNQTYDKLTKRAVSYLQLTPTVADDGATLACMATNLAIPQGRNSKADVITLNVTYIPIVEISVNGTSKFTVIENETLNLLCEVKANPPVGRIMWYFNGLKIENSGVVSYNVSLNMLILHEIKRIHSGLYSCVAANALGETNAEPIDISVFYPPECTGNGLTLSEETLICNVTAIPIPNKYVWYMQSDSQIETYTTETSSIALSNLTLSLVRTLNVSCKAVNDVDSQNKPCTRNFSFKHLRPPQLQQCDLAYENEQFQIRCIPVDNATHYEVSVWRQSRGNASLTLDQKRVLGFGASQALTVNTAESLFIKGELGSLGREDEAGAAACNRYGCSTVLLLRPTERLLSAVVVPWWKFLLDKTVGISIGGVLLVIVFLTSTTLVVCIAKRSCGKRPAPVIQVLRIDDITRDIRSSSRDLKARSSCTLRSRSSGRLDGTEELDLTSWQHSPVLYDFEPPPDVTLTMHRESTV